MATTQLVARTLVVRHQRVPLTSLAMASLMCLIFSLWLVFGALQILQRTSTVTALLVLLTFFLLSMVGGHAKVEAIQLALAVQRVTVMLGLLLNAKASVVHTKATALPALATHVVAAVNVKLAGRLTAKALASLTMSTLRG
jgi:hypothetical protein